MEINNKVMKSTAENSTISKNYAPGEDRTRDLQIMRLTRCLLRYQGQVKN